MQSFVQAMAGMHTCTRVEECLSVSCHHACSLSTVFGLNWYLAANGSLHPDVHVFHKINVISCSYFALHVREAKRDAGKFALCCC